MADKTYSRLRTPLRYGLVLGFVGGFLMAYQRSSCEMRYQFSARASTYIWTVRFWGWSENSREQDLDMKELSERARKGLPIYGHSDEPEWVQGAAYRNSAFSQLKFSA